MQSYRAISLPCSAAVFYPAAQCTTSLHPRTRDHPPYLYHGGSGSFSGCTSGFPSSTRQRRHASTTAPHQWPTPPTGCTTPTPYQIFSLTPSSPYTKSRFYELVKLYHPDRSPTPGLSPATRLERYRLIVAAHTLLSDPAKRIAYDRCGAGWDGMKERSFGGAAPFTPRGDIWANATWEDWEAWRERQEGGSQEPVYMRNGAFIAAVLAVAAVAGSWNVSRAETEGQRFLAARDRVHDDTVRELRRVRQLSDKRQKEERIDWFVRNREASMGIGVQQVREEKERRVLGEEGRCGIEDG